MLDFPFVRAVSSAVESSLCRLRISSSDSAKLTPVSPLMSWRGMTLRLIDGETGVSFAESLEEMRNRHNELSTALETARTKGKSNIQRAFSDVRELHRGTQWLMVGISAICLLLLAAVSVMLIRSLTR